jgi:replication factor C subunit 3/5
MVFLIDKYKINSLSNIIYNKHIYKTLFYNYKNKKILSEYELYPSMQETIELLNNINNDKDLYNFIKIHIKTNNKSLIEHAQRYIDMPNLLIYGSNGSGKKTLINLLLKDIYDNKIDNIKNVSYTINGYSNTSAEIIVKQSNYHLIIEPTNTGIDKYLIHEVVKEYAQQTILNTNDIKTPFRIVLINNIDNLSYYAQTSLRCTMEKYYKTCKFILCGYQISKIIEPIRSRCLHVRLPKPTINELFSILFNISCNENIIINENELIRICKLSNCNIKKAIYMLDMYKYNITNYKLSWEKKLEFITNNIINFILDDKIIIYNSNLINKFRSILYNIFTTNISGEKIIIQLITNLFKKINNNIDPILLSIIIQIFGYYETRINKGKRSIIHIEALINSIFYHIKLYQNNIIVGLPLL